MRYPACTILITAAALGFAIIDPDPVSGQVAAESASVDAGWPRQVTSGSTSFTVYQPQIDSWQDDRLALRVAVAATEPGQTDPEYGVVWLTARTEVDKDSRMVSLLELTVTRASFPGAPAESDDWKGRLQAVLPAECSSIALDRLESALAERRELMQGAATALRNDPPEIIFSSTPAVLVLIDGTPVLRPAGSGIQRVINTRVLLLKTEDAFYLHLFDGWMRATTLTGSWSVASRVPGSLTTVLNSEVADNEVDLLEGTPADSTQPAPTLSATTAPAVLIRTAPAELIVTDGAPDYLPVDSTALLYVENTTGRVFKSTADNDTYVLASGRWFRSKSTQGPWTFVQASKLPADFARIPDWSPLENVKASVPGTTQAREAMIANSIPQTATVDRKGTTLDPAPVIDGDPQYRPIPSTSLHYVLNASLPIIQTGPDAFYTVQNGVWFVARATRGPWLVAASVPAEIYSIPPSSPLYYVTFVRVYDATEDLVYEGYTPGYLGTVLDPDGVVVYGTGYTYDPWIGVDWFGAPWSYGLGACVRWTPWTGWGFAFGFGRSWGRGRGFAWGGLGWGPRPWWGASSWWWGRGNHFPGGHGPGRGPRGGWEGTSGSLYARWNGHGVINHHPQDRGGVWGGAGRRGQFGAAYNSRNGGLEAGQHAPVRNIESYGRMNRPQGPGPQRNTTAPRAPSPGRSGPAHAPPPNRGAPRATTSQSGHQQPDNHGGRNNVFAGPGGEVYRQGASGGWEQRQGHDWHPAGPMPTMEGENHARQQGETRAQGFRGVERGVGGSRGGGSRGGSPRGGTRH